MKILYGYPAPYEEEEDTISSLWIRQIEEMDKENLHQVEVSDEVAEKFLAAKKELKAAIEEFEPVARELSDAIQAARKAKKKILNKERDEGPLRFI